MPTTRSSARNAGSPSSSQASNGSKRKADSSPSASPAKPKKVKSSPKKSEASPKKQKTIEETFPDVDDDDETQAKSEDAEMKDAEAETEDSVTKISESNGILSEAQVDEKKNQEEPKSKGESEPKDRNIEASTNEDATHDSAAKSDSVVDKSTGNEAEKTASTDKAVDEKHESAAESKPKVETVNGKEEIRQESTEHVSKTDTQTVNNSNKSDSTDPKPTQDDAVEHSSQREKATPSSIMEKGIIYFFFRGRVGIDDPSKVDDLARSYIVLRPLPKGAKLTDGSISDQNNLRVLALPKKVLPKGPNDRFMVFVEKSEISLEELKKEFLSSTDYDTQTAGTRHSPAATPIGEGVYALTSTGRETHLAYILTIPKELSEVQRDIGLQEKGSWVTSVKNPEHKGPAGAQLPQDPKFPKEILDEFRTLRWGQLQPKHLNYENCQLLLIGHKDHSFAKATENDDKEVDPKEEIEKLASEEEDRVLHLDGDDTVFEDLNLDAKEYPSVQTTW